MARLESFMEQLCCLYYALTVIQNVYWMADFRVKRKAPQVEYLLHITNINIFAPVIIVRVIWFVIYRLEQYKKYIHVTHCNFS